MSVDPTNSRARQRAISSLSREINFNRSDNDPVPSIGGNKDYPLRQREKIIDKYDRIASYWEAANRVGYYIRTVKRWETHMVPYRMTGGKARDKLVGADQLLLSIVIYVNNNTSADKLCVFVVANSGQVYSRQNISKRCSELVITRKHFSREAYDDFSADRIKN